MYSTNNRKQVKNSTVSVPIKTSRIVFDATQPRPGPANFDKGLFRSLPSYRMPYTAADVAEAAQMFGELSDRWESEWEPDDVIDQREFEAACIERYCKGWL